MLLNESMPLWLLLFCLVVWLVVCIGLPRLSGWSKFAQTFRSQGRVGGKTFYFVFGMIGKDPLLVKFGNLLFVTVNDQGIRLSVLWVFGVFCPALLIPWDQVESVDSSGLSLSPFGGVTIRVRGYDEVVVLHGKVGECVRQEHVLRQGA